jgi:proteasome lid subunit RPN8/RPN11
VCFVISTDGDVLWSDASTSPVALPDSRARWEAIWNNRERLGMIAHTHPVGPHAFSQEDVTTMEALTVALGKAVPFAVVSVAGMLVRNSDGVDEEVADEPPWTKELRELSGMKPREEE